MKRIFSILFGSSLCIIFLYLLFMDVEQLIAAHLQSPASLMGYIALSFSFLLLDILLPVPSSFVMILNGKMLGIVWGSLLSLGSGLISSTLGYFLGRKSGPLFSRIFSERERASGNRFFVRYGKGAIVLSKALPVLSESVSFVSGTTSIRYGSFFIFSLCGHAVVSLVYAYVGSATTALNSNVVSAIVIAATLVLAWILQLILQPEPSKPAGINKSS